MDEQPGTSPQALCLGLPGRQLSLLRVTPLVQIVYSSQLGSDGPCSAAPATAAARCSFNETQASPGAARRGAPA